MSTSNNKIIVTSLLYLLIQYLVAPTILNITNYNSVCLFLYFFSIIGIACYFLYLLKSHYYRDLSQIKENKKYILIMLGLFLLSFLIYPFFSSPNMSANETGIQLLNSKSSGINSIFLASIVIIFSPIIEEVIFQFIIQKGIYNYAKKQHISTKISTTLSLIITTLLFVCIHNVNPLDISTIGLFIILLNYALCFRLTNSNLLLTTLFHMLWNSVPYLLILLVTIFNHFSWDFS